MQSWDRSVWKEEGCATNRKCLLKKCNIFMNLLNAKVSSLDTKWLWGHRQESDVFSEDYRSSPFKAAGTLWTRTGAPALCENRDATVLAPGAQFLPRWQRATCGRSGSVTGCLSSGTSCCSECGLTGVVSFQSSENAQEPWSLTSVVIWTTERTELQPLHENVLHQNLHLKNVLKTSHKMNWTA